ncbi:MAG: hypothetical protein ACKV2T_20990 [Kofleriaceae bacterium]
MRLSLVMLAMLAIACSRASDEAPKKTWADTPPPADMPVPANLSIAVTVDGAAHAPITAATLAKKADFEDAERSAWLIASLVPDATNIAAIEATSPTGMTVKFDRPNPAGLEPVLFLTRRGDVIVSAIDPKDPFPRYHGQGGRLHRAGDSNPRVNPVAKLAITRKP